MRNSLLWLAAVGCFGACLCGCNGIHGGGDAYDETGGFVGIGPTERARLFAKVVDLPSLPADAGTIEIGTYRYLLETVMGHREPALRKLTSEETTYDGLEERPDRHRGEVFIAYGMVLEMSMDEPPTGWPTRGHRVWRGMIGSLEGELYAFRALMPRTGKVPRLGQMVWFSGYFLKRYAFRGSDGEIHHAPLLVGPGPTLTDKRFPIYAVARKLGLDKFLPSSPCSRRVVENRLLIEVSRDGSLGADGRPVDREGLDILLDREAELAYQAPGTRDWGVVIWFERGVGRDLIDELSGLVRAKRVLYPVLKVKPD